MFPLFYMSLSLNGFPIKAAQKELQKSLHIPEMEYASYITNKKEAIVKYHLENNPFYQSFVPNPRQWTWEALPIMTKKALQQPLDQRLSKNFNTQNIYRNATSGSSGTPFVFAKDKFCHALTWASNIERFGWHQIDFNQSLQARFYGIPMDFWGYHKERCKDFLANRYRFPVFDLSDTVLTKFVHQFRKQKFDYINGYTSAIVLFAKYLEQENIILKEICPTLKGCFVTSEMLFDSDKKLLEKQLQIPIIREYGASELDLIAFENVQGEWLVNTETLFVEILDENNQVVPPGTEGKIVVTSLYNKAHPFIRYELGDRGVLDPKSTPKKTILHQLIGRTNDMVILPSGKKSAGLTFYYITKSIIEDDGMVKEFVIRQTQLDTFEIDYVSDVALTTSQIASIHKAIALYLEPNLHFRFYQKATLNRNNRGKLKQFESLIK